MSSIKLLVLFNTLNIQSVKCSVVTTGREALAEFVQQQMAVRNWSTYDVVRESGGFISSNGTVWNILNLRVRDVREDTLKGLAKAFAVDNDVVFDVYRGKAVEPMSPQDFYSALEALGVEQFNAYGGVHNLSAEDQQEIIAMVSTLVEQKLKRKQVAGKAKPKK